MENSTLVAVSVGNTRTRWGVFRDGSLDHAQARPTTDADALAAEIATAAGQDATIAIATVNLPGSRALEAALTPRLDAARGEILRFGEDLPIPIARALDDDTTVGQDRLLCALGAYSKAKQACVVIDAGTAITVDFVDGEGTFQGGAIAPGLGMMLRSLHQHTAALPDITFEPVPPQRPFGKATAEAMRLGVQQAARGLVRTLVERYAEVFGAYPQIVATGGDAATLFEHDDLVEHLVPDLVLMGIHAAIHDDLDT